VGQEVNTDALLAEIKADEGWLPYGYSDYDSTPVACKGWLTIGYGFLIDSRKGVGLPRPVAEFWLRYAVNERVEELERRWPAFKDQPEDVQLAIANMAYNLGVSGLLKFTDMLNALERGERAQAATDALQSIWATQVPKRARKIAALIRGVP
jgi:lysozyme